MNRLDGTPKIFTCFCVDCGFKFFGRSGIAKWCPACVVRRSFCACGCGEKIKYRYARYRAGHYMLGRHLVFTDLHKKRISLGARRRFKNKKAHEQMSFSMRKYFATHPVESQRMAKAHVVWQGLNRSEWRLRALLVRYGFRF